MPQKQKLTATIFGASGLVGKQLAIKLSENADYKKVYVANRRKIGYNSLILEEKIIDFEKLDQYPEIFEVDQIFIALGTTMKKAGSKEKFRYVDFELPRRIVERTKADTILMISSLGADPNSSNFYLKTKGQAEKLILESGVKFSYVVRPSMLLGDRKEKRLGEAIGRFLFEKLDFIMRGPLEKYRGIYDTEVAGAMIRIARDQGEQQIIESKELKQIASHEHT